jgi:hypothetical protein
MTNEAKPKSGLVIDDGARHAAHLASRPPSAPMTRAQEPATPYSRAAKRSAWKLLDKRDEVAAG